jgi:hypothetical protein
VKEPARHPGEGDFAPIATGSSFASDDAILRPIHRASSVFHPPRGN